MADNYEDLGLTVLQTETLLVGCFYKNPDFYVEWGQFMKSKYDLFDEATRFFYDNFELMYKTFSQKYDAININAFMSQDKDRFKLYKRFGGYSTIEAWKGFASVDDFKNYYDLVKKFSLMRELYRNGYPVQKVRDYKKFDSLSANEVYRLLRSKIDNIHTVILANEDSVNIAEGTIDALLECIETPDMGLAMPYPTLSEVFKGIRKSSMQVNGMLSNEGKTRYLTKLAAYVAFFHDEKILVMLNETTEKEFRHCLITTVINNPEFQALHGVKINKKEREITLGQYLDNKGEFLVRRVDNEGNYMETLSEFQQRLGLESDEFNKVLEISKWVEENSKGKIYLKTLTEYKDEILEFEIRKHKLTKGISYFCYDTLKNDNNSIGDWAAFKKTVTNLSELVKEIDAFLYASIQLTDEAVHLDIFNLTSMNIANSKQIKHLLDQLYLMKRIPKDEYHKYSYIPSDAWGDVKRLPLKDKKTYYGCVVDKNRQGTKPILLFEVNLDYNTWFEVGRLVKGGC